MKKCYFLLLFLSLIVVDKSYGQCPGEEVLMLLSQSDVDAFLVDFPDCSELAGDVFIADTDADPITNLDGLQNLISINGYLRIQNNNSLQNLNGLEGLVLVGGNLRIQFNDNLQNLNGFLNLSSINGGLLINSAK